VTHGKTMDSTEAPAHSAERPGGELGKHSELGLLMARVDELKERMETDRLHQKWGGRDT
jgi:hypothetical protein